MNDDESRTMMCVTKLVNSEEQVPPKETMPSSQNFFSQSMSRLSSGMSMYATTSGMTHRLMSRSTYLTLVVASAVETDNVRRSQWSSCRCGDDGDGLALGVVVVHEEEEEDEHLGVHDEEEGDDDEEQRGENGEHGVMIGVEGIQARERKKMRCTSCRMRSFETSASSFVSSA